MTNPSPALDVLLIEDDEIDALAMRRALKILGFDGTVTAVSSIPDACERLGNEHSTDLVLLDLSLGGESGIDLLAHLRSLETACPPIVVLTSSDEPRDRSNCYRNGASGYFVKPSSMHGLKETVRTILDYWTRSIRPAG